MSVRCYFKQARALPAALAVRVLDAGSRVERLPRPAPAGEAPAKSLTDGRPGYKSRAVFVTVRRPYRQFKSGAVRQVMGRACDLAGVRTHGAHRLCHALTPCTANPAVLAGVMGFRRLISILDEANR